jgi:hypothetical protein
MEYVGNTMVLSKGKQVTTIIFLAMMAGSIHVVELPAGRFCETIADRIMIRWQIANPEYRILQGYKCGRSAET